MVGVSHSAGQPQSYSHVQDQSHRHPRERSHSHHRSRERSQSRRQPCPRSRSHGHSHSHGQSRSWGHSRSRDRSRSHSQSHSPHGHHSRSPHSHCSRSRSRSRSPGYFTAEQKGKKRASPHYRNRPGPSHLARPKTVEKQPTEINNREQSEEAASKQAVSKDELVYWRHVGKEFGMTVQAWLAPSMLAYACWCKSQEDRDPEVQDIMKYLNGSGLEPELWMMRRFQSEV